MFTMPSPGSYKEKTMSTISIFIALSTMTINLSSVLSIMQSFPPGDQSGLLTAASALIDNVDNVMLALLLISSAPGAICAICCR
jgi:hypothetical protein